MDRTVILLGSHDHGSGAERVLEYLLTGSISRRDEICLLSPASSSVTTFAQNLGYTWIPWETRTDSLKENLRAYWRLVHHPDFDPGDGIVHSWHTRHLEWAWMLGRHWKIPASGTIHDDPHPEHHHFGRVRKKIIRASAKRLDGVAVVSAAIEKRCAELGWTCNPVIIRNGLPNAPLVHGEPSSVLRLGFLAATVLWKGVTLLPELVHSTTDLPVEWHLFGAPEPETVPFVEKLSRLPGVHFHGQVPLDAALPHIDVMLHLSLALDPYPTVLLEAARAGIPVIASRTGGTPEIVADGQTGVLVPAGDVPSIEAAIRHFLAYPESRRQMGLAARKRFEKNFRVAHMVADYFAFWDRLRSHHS